MQKQTKTKLFILAFAATVGGGAIATNPSFAATDTSLPANSSIIDYNKADALKAIIDSSLEQMPEFALYYEMDTDFQKMNGLQAGAFITPDGSIVQGSSPSIAHTNLLRRLEGITDTSGTGWDKYTEYIALITAAKNNPECKNKAECVAAVEAAYTESSQGRAGFNKHLPIADPTLTDVETKSDAEINAIYNNLPAVKNGTYSDMIKDAQVAQSIVDAYAEGTIDQKILSEAAVRVFNNFLAAAKAINPDFSIDLSKVPKLPSNQTSSTPTAPNTGKTSDGEISATIITVAVTTMAALATISGATIVARRYLFSPLKRRK